MPRAGGGSRSAPASLRPALPGTCVPHSVGLGAGAREAAGEGRGEGAFARGWRRLTRVPAQPAPMRYLKDGEEVAQVGDIPFAQAFGHSLGPDSLSIPAEFSPRAYPGPPRPGQKFFLPAALQPPRPTGQSAAVTCGELGTRAFRTQKVSNRCPGDSLESILPTAHVQPPTVPQPLLGICWQVSRCAFREYAPHRKMVVSCPGLKMLFLGPLSEFLSQLQTRGSVIHVGWGPLCYPERCGSPLRNS